MGGACLSFSLAIPYLETERVSVMAHYSNTAHWQISLAVNISTLPNNLSKLILRICTGHQ